MLSCAFESFLQKELPIQIIIGDAVSMFETKYIATDRLKADRILKSVPIKIGAEALMYVRYIYLANIDQKELSLIHFLIEGYKHKSKFVQILDTGFGPSRRMLAGVVSNPHIAKINKGVNLLTLESMRFVQFVRFEDYSGKLISVIEPENNILPLISEHFVDRYPNEDFLIYDKTHRLGLIYTDGQARIEQIEDFCLPARGEEELAYQKLWQLFYDTISIEERRNERCRMNFLPKKYRKNMTEFLSLDLSDNS